MIKDIEFIQSTYKPTEAIEVLGNLIQQKMAYHTQKTLRHQEMFGSPDPLAELRLVELKNLKKQLLFDLKKLHPDTLLQINGLVSINIIAEQQAS